MLVCGMQVMDKYKMNVYRKHMRLTKALDGSVCNHMRKRFCTEIAALSPPVPQCLIPVLVYGTQVMDEREMNVYRKHLGLSTVLDESVCNHMHKRFCPEIVALSPPEPQ